VVLLRLSQAADTGPGFRNDDEAVALEEPARNRAEGAVVVDDEDAPRNGRIVTEQSALRSVASPKSLPSEG
jgi:hypothetical protein